MERLSQHYTKIGLLRYVLPVVVTMLIGSAYGAIDGLFVSNMVGKTALASIAIVAPFVMILSTLGVMMGAGGGAIVGQLLGSGRIKDANRGFSLIAAVTLTAGMLCSIVGIIAMDQVVLLLGASPDIFPMAVLYGRIVFLSMPMFMLTYVFELFAGTAGRPGLGLASATVAGVVNIGLDALFMGILGWGVAGAAVATCLAEYASGILMFILYKTGRAGVLRLVRPRWIPGVLARSAFNGISEMVDAMAMSAVAMAYNLQLMGLYGENGVAAYAVIEYAAMFIGAILGGLSDGIAPLMSFQQGAGNASEKRSLFRQGFFLTAVASVLAFLVAQIMARPLALVFVGYDPNLTELTVSAFRVYSLAFLLMGVTYFAASMLTAVENGKASALISFVHTFVFEIGLVFLLPALVGASGIWWSICAAEAAAAILSFVITIKLGKRYGWIMRKL